MKKAVIAMSGGVDSAVAALLLQRQGFECVGLYMKMFDKSDKNFAFAGENGDEDDARRVCEALSMRFICADAVDLFKRSVIEAFIGAYEAGLTPNPCVLCNKAVKFELLRRYAASEGCDIYASGHYANVQMSRKYGRFVIKKAADIKKDQSYMLAGLTQEQLGGAVLPLGGEVKEQVRKTAEAAALINSQKKDSQDVCFIPNGRYGDFLRRYTGRSYEQGCYTDETGRVIGRHTGIVDYTVGQRRGINISLGRRVYVSEKNAAANTVTLAGEEALYKKTVLLGDFNGVALSSAGEADSLICTAKLRYSHTEHSAKVKYDGRHVSLTFDEPQRAPTPGQTAVLYDGDTVLGAGTIIAAE